MAKRKNTEIVLAGRNIYIDEHDRYVYFNKRDNFGYIIKSEYAQEYQTLSKRAFFGLLAGIVLYAFLENIAIAAFVGILTYLVLVLRFYKKFLPKLPQVKGFVPEKHMKRIDVLASDDSGRLLLKAILFVALAILLPLRALEIQTKDIYLYIVYLISAGAIVYALIHVYAVFYKKKHPVIQQPVSVQKNRKTTR